MQIDSHHPAFLPIHRGLFLIRHVEEGPPFVSENLDLGEEPPLLAGDQIDTA